MKRSIESLITIPRNLFELHFHLFNPSMLQIITTYSDIFNEFSTGGLFSSMCSTWVDWKKPKRQRMKIDARKLSSILRSEYRNERGNGTDYIPKAHVVLRLEDIRTVLFVSWFEFIIYRYLRAFHFGRYKMITIHHLSKFARWVGCKLSDGVCVAIQGKPVIFLSAYWCSSGIFVGQWWKVHARRWGEKKPVKDWKRNLGAKFRIEGFKIQRNTNV